MLLLHLWKGNSVGVSVFWDNEVKTIVRYLCDEHWTWEEFFAAKDQAYTLIDTVAHNVGVIVDSPFTPVLPPNMLVEARKAIRTKHPNTKIAVLIIKNSVLRTIVTTMKHAAPVAGSLIEITSSLEDARRIVASRLHGIAERSRALSGEMT
jgi:hypothetical protein